MLLLSTAALAGPLDRPDPMDMGRLHCAERPLGLTNNAPLSGGRTLGEAPAGPPTFPTGLQSSLLPYATDEALDKAEQKHLVPLSAVSTLATGASPVLASCEGAPTDVYDFVSESCEKPRRCKLLAVVDGATVTFDDQSSVGTRLAPVETIKEAVGLLALVEPDLFLPLTPGELEAWTLEAAGYRPVLPALPWLEVEEKPEGYVIRAARRVECGCEHDVVRRGYFVAKDGRTCPIAEEGAVVLAVAVDPVCRQPKP